MAAQLALPAQLIRSIATVDDLGVDVMLLDEQLDEGAAHHAHVAHLIGGAQLPRAARVRACAHHATDRALGQPRRLRVGGTRAHRQFERGAWQRQRLLAQAHVQQVLTGEANRVRDAVDLMELAVRVQGARLHTAEAEADPQRIRLELQARVEFHHRARNHNPVR